MDTLSIAIGITLAAFAPAKANMDRQSAFRAPAPVSIVAFAPRTAKAPEKATTCYMNKNGSCWSE